MYDEDDDIDFAEELDEVQESLYVPARWSWTFWLSNQCSNVGDILDTFGKMFHDTTIHLRQHYNYKLQKTAQEDMILSSMREIDHLTGE